MRLKVGFILAAAIVGVMFVYLLTPRESIPQSGPVFEVLPIEEGSRSLDSIESDVKELSLSPNDQTHRFSIDSFAIEFGSEIPQEDRLTIRNDLETLLGGRNYRLQPNSSTSFSPAVLEDKGLVPAFNLSYVSDESSIGLRIPRALNERSSRARQSLTELFMVGDSETLFLSPELIEVYENQIQLSQDHPNEFLDLESFVDRINNISSEPMSSETLKDVYYRSQSDDLVSTFESVDPEMFLAPLIGTRYRRVSLLDVVPATYEFDMSSLNSLDIAPDSLIATIESNFINQGTILGGVQTVPLIYTDNGWKIWLRRY